MSGFEMSLAGVVLATGPELPPQRALAYEYVVAANGLFKRAEDSRLAALAPVWLSDVDLPGADPVDAYLQLKVGPVPEKWLWSIWSEARRRLPDEVMFQLFWSPDEAGSFKGWKVAMPAQIGSPMALDFADAGEAAIDLHSHNTMGAFFSGTDDADEQGLRIYVVIGHLDQDRPQIAVRVGVYGAHLDLPATAVFDGLGPFVDVYQVEALEAPAHGS